MRASLTVIRGGGELGSAAAHALASAGLRVLVIDRPRPGALRWGVAFASAILDGAITIEGVTGVYCRDEAGIEAAWRMGQVAVVSSEILPAGERPDVLVDARMRQLTEPMLAPGAARLVVGIGPGFVAGRDVHLVIESNRGPRLGTLVRSGQAEAHTGVPGEVLGLREDRVLRAPRAGAFVRMRALGDFVEPGDVVGSVDGAPVRTSIAGMIRGLKLDGIRVGFGHKVGDVDPRRDPALLGCMTDKARAIGRAAVSAVAEAGLLGSVEDPATEGSIACT